LQAKVESAGQGGAAIAAMVGLAHRVAQPMARPPPVNKSPWYVALLGPLAEELRHRYAEAKERVTDSDEEIPGAQPVSTTTERPDHRQVLLERR